MSFDRPAYMKHYHKEHYQRNKKRIDKANVAYYHKHKAITLEYKREYYTQRKDTWRERDYQRRYGISLGEYDALWYLQGFKCAICGQNKFKRFAPSIDHKHGTKIIRGLLCGDCNSGLGYFKDNPRLFRIAAKYVNRRVL